MPNVDSIRVTKHLDSNLDVICLDAIGRSEKKHVAWTAKYDLLVPVMPSACSALTKHVHTGWGCT